MSKKPPPIGFLADFDEPPPTAPPPPPPKESDTSNTPVSPSSPKGNRPKIELTWIDKIYRFFYSKQEFEAYLIEKELKRRGKFCQLNHIPI